MSSALHNGSDDSQLLYNISEAVSTESDLFLACWGIQSCETCLASRHPCSWCTTSQVCVPNTRAPFPFQILAPIKYEDICPMTWRERWELRAKPFSCRCSTMTLISVAVAVLSTLVGVILLWALAKLARLSSKRWQARDREWWRRQRLKLTRAHHVDDEQRPLLAET